MRNLIIIFLFCITVMPLSAQRFGYVDTDYILENLPQYSQAQKTLQNQTQQWNQDIQNRQAAVNKRQADFLNEKVLLTEDQIKKEELEIDQEIAAIKQLQEKRYGQEGDLIRLRKSLVKPIQDQVWIAVKQVAEKRNYGFIFDKGSDLIMVYTDPKFDISREVLLQLNPNAVEKKSSAPASSGSKGNTNTRSKPASKPAKSNTRPNTQGKDNKSLK
ncbi:MAG: OmpH family outer membrane protein [Weeksellaceae bacterium]